MIIPFAYHLLMPAVSRHKAIGEEESCSMKKCQNKCVSINESEMNRRNMNNVLKLFYSYLFRHLRGPLAFKSVWLLLLYLILF